MKLFIKIIITVFCITGSFQIEAQEAWSPQHVYYGKGGKMTYTPDEKGNTIPDFSHVGYRYGDKPIPDIPTVIEIEPDEADSGETIQQAIESLYNNPPDENGFRGALLLKKGVYKVEGQIKIEKSGIVLRGEGNSDSGTVIVAEGSDRRALIYADNKNSGVVDSSTVVDIIEEYLPVGRRFVVVSDTKEYNPGDKIIIYRPATSEWISDLKMDQLPPHDDGSPVYQWSPTDYSFSFERTITKINGDTLFFRNPVVMAIDAKYGGGSIYKYHFNRLQNIGIENLCLKSAYISDTDEEHSWTGILFQNIEHSWIRDINFWHFAFGGVNLEREARLITVENCNVYDPKSLVTGSRRYSFYLSGSLNLFQNLTSNNARHDFATNSAVTGPNVFSNGRAKNSSADIGPHHRWAMGTLYENIVTDGTINIQDRGNTGTGHGWAGANTVLWSCKASTSVCQSPYVSAKNFNFGFTGGKMPGRPGRPDGVWVGHNIPNIFPASLYQAQLDERLNNTALFSVLPYLEVMNDSTLLMHFSMPIMTKELKSSNFTISGTTPLTNNEFSISIESSDAVKIVSSKFKINSENSSIIVTANNILNYKGETLNGLSSAVFIVPDKRPVVNGTSAFTDNIDGALEASSSKPGIIYLVKYGLSIKTQSALDSLVSINQGRRVETGKPDSIVIIYTEGLPGGYYEYYATDSDGRVSDSSFSWVSVNEKGPVSSIDNPTLNSFQITIEYENMYINPGTDDEVSIAVYSLKGETLYSDTNRSGVRVINCKTMEGVIIVRMQNAGKTEIKKIVCE